MTFKIQFDGWNTEVSSVELLTQWVSMHAKLYKQIIITKIH